MTIYTIGLSEYVAFCDRLGLIFIDTNDFIAIDDMDECVSRKRCEIVLKLINNAIAIAVLDVSVLYSVLPPLKLLLLTSSKFGHLQLSLECHFRLRFIFHA